ncbi:MAG TPA: GNAT family N-acetyltransferase [Streptosporangiaceae bacterium]|nr:GNAT family N-acetyltransferase [Streptosporangiaceae bacterium]
MDTYALLADGTTVEIRPATPGDYDAVKAMHTAMSPDNSYLRFFNFSQLSAEREAERMCREPRPGRTALLALAGGQVAGCGSYDVEPGGKAEVAFAVAEHMHHRGIATLLLEHLVSAARSHGITTFTAQTLGENTPMLHVFADAGLPVQRHYEDGVVEVRIPLPQDGSGTTLDRYLEKVALREGTADAASLRHVFAPQSVVVIGASRRTGTVGRAIIDNIRTCGYTGRLYAVSPRAHQVGGVHCVPGVADLPEAPELAVIAIPAPAVLNVAEECGKLGVKALVVIASGLDTPACADLLATCRRHGMRLVGPDSFGVAIPGIGLDATFAAGHPLPGTAGLVMQSGGLGLALMDQLSRLGIGISSFASVGSKLDVSSNDMLLWWEQDGLTKLAVLYIESFGNPRKFARTARRVGDRMPVLTVYSGHDERTRVLFEQAGIIATPGLGELTETAALLATQPVPAGRTIAIVSNVGGAGALAADACTDLGLTVHRPRGMIRRKLRALIPDTGTVTGPVDTTAAVSAADFRQCIELIAADEDVDAILALVLPTAATGDLVTAIQQAAVSVPIAAVVLNQAESVRMLEERIPAYAYPEAAVAALARAARYGAWRMEPRGQVPSFPDVQAGTARCLVREFLCDNPEGGWLAPDETADLLGCYGIPLAELTPVSDEETAVAVAAAIGGPVVLKADVPGLVHKTEAGAVQLDLRSEADVRRAYRWLRDHFGQTLRRILVQPMITGGTEVIVGVADDHMFGPLIVFGLDGVTTEELAEPSSDKHSARLAPLSDTDADKLIHSIRSAPLLQGYRDQPSSAGSGEDNPPEPSRRSAADLDALRDLLLRVSRLAEDLPEITDLDLSPVIARPDGVYAVDARIKVAACVPRDPFLRKLR